MRTDETPPGDAGNDPTGTELELANKPTTPETPAGSTTPVPAGTGGGVQPPTPPRPVTHIQVTLEDLVATIDHRKPPDTHIQATPEERRKHTTTIVIASGIMVGYVLVIAFLGAAVLMGTMTPAEFIEFMKPYVGLPLAGLLGYAGLKQLNSGNNDGT